ncbi:hypothetical protein LCGC14_2846550 [marine sediment metagenome]|uniref:Uncharacterized protein n=1 Tax=marine sediment metagenome TaxID=412755 RepID=A0A0F8YWC6_9ZZZZ
MTLLTEENKQKVFVEIEDELSSEFVSVSFGRPDGRDAIDVVDQWVEDNFTSFNNVLPAEVKSSLSTKWKIKLLEKIIKRRWEVE